MKIELEKILKKKINVGLKIPLRKWSKDWQLPDECRIEKYKTKLNAHRREVEVERFRLLGKMSSIKSAKAKKWYEGSSTRGLEYVIEDGYTWCVFKSNLPLPIEITPSQLSTDGEWLYLSIPSNYIGIWYQYGNGRINFFILPKELKLDEEFEEVFGILQGEMLQKGKEIRISNSEPKIINLLLEFFDENKIIRKDAWDLTVSINSKNISEDQKQQICENIRKYWSTQLSIPPDRIRNIYWYDQFNSTLDPNYGEINLRFNNASLRKVIDFLLEFAKKKALENKNFAIGFLRGLFAAEGSVEISKDGRLLEVRLAAKKLKDRKLYKKICEVAGLQASCEIKHHHVRVHNLTNFFKCLEYDIFKLHAKKKENFILQLKKFVTVRALYYICESPKTVKELVELLKLDDYRNLNKNLSRLTRENIINRVMTKKGYVYFPTKRLEGILHLLKNSI
jgi:hypothetical protein